MTSVLPASCLAHPLVPMPTDDVITDTSLEQVKTEQEIRQLLSLYIPQPAVGSSKAKAAVLDINKIELNRAAHARWLGGILRPLPAPYTTLDASRPWLLYWVTHSLAIMDGVLDAPGKEQGIATIKSFWNAEQGGFGGGPGQMAHLAPTYASVSALAYLDDGSNSAWDWIDRQAIHNWMLTLKQPDGSFVMHKGGEVDVRGCYCALTVAVLLNILTPDLARGTFEFIASCQTYEGGLASASYPGSTVSAPLGEAHGGYSYCALASYFALLASPVLQASSPSSANGQASKSNIAPLNARALLRWATHMQGLPIEAGGFRGRSNKLVDGCYSWWCGGLFNILDAMLGSENADDTNAARAELYNRVGLQEYVLIAAQGPHGGLRDKPGKGTDAYHTCYNLSGLAAAQHVVEYKTPDVIEDLTSEWVDVIDASSSSSSSDAETAAKPLAIVKGKNESLEEANKRMKDIFISALAWKEDESRKIIVGRNDSAVDNEVIAVHPVYAVTMPFFDKMMRWSYGQPPKIGLEEVSDWE